MKVHARCLSFIVLYFFSSVAWSEDMYAVLYGEGIERYESGQFWLARDSFEQSFDLLPNAKTAYYIAQSSYQVRDYRTAANYAVRALEFDSPKLTEPHLSYLKGVVGNIARRYQTSRMTLTMSHDEMETMDLEKRAFLEAEVKSIENIIPRLRELGAISKEETVEVLVPDYCSENYFIRRSPEMNNYCISLRLQSADSE